MIELSATAYPWIKALHIIAVVAWMAGMLYLPRLFVYHCEAEPGSDQSETFKVMERRLLRAIVNPAMIAALVFGGILLANLDADQWRDGWLHAKLALVAGAVRHAPFDGPLAQGVRAGRKHPPGEILPADERGPGRPDGRHRHSGGGQAVLGFRCLDL